MGGHRKAVNIIPPPPPCCLPPPPPFVVMAGMGGHGWDGWASLRTTWTGLLPSDCKAPIRNRQAWALRRAHHITCVGGGWSCCTENGPKDEENDVEVAVHQSVIAVVLVWCAGLVTHAICGQNEG